MMNLTWKTKSFHLGMMFPRGHPVWDWQKGTPHSIHLLIKGIKWIQELIGHIKKTHVNLQAIMNTVRVFYLKGSFGLAIRGWNILVDALTWQLVLLVPISLCCSKSRSNPSFAVWGSGTSLCFWSISRTLCQQKETTKCYRLRQIPGEPKIYFYS